MPGASPIIVPVDQAMKDPDTASAGAFTLGPGGNTTGPTVTTGITVPVIAAVPATTGRTGTATPMRTETRFRVGSLAPRGTSGGPRSPVSTPGGSVPADQSGAARAGPGAVPAGVAVAGGVSAAPAVPAVSTDPGLDPGSGRADPAGAAASGSSSGANSAT